MTYQRLKINRFVAIRNNRIMYDQLFHDGINVIRGEHSVGKSTLLDLIFYSLGGELKEKEWKSPLTQYEKVIIEVTIGTRTLTLSRQIETNNKKPYINVFEGNLDDALLNHNKWLPLGPSRSENKMSFSEFLFEALGWGQSITSEHNNLTMHQILRLLYLSQTSNSTNIFRSEPHLDKESTRQAIGDFLLGLDDLSLYEIRQNIWKLRRSIEQKNSDIKSYRRLLNIDESTTIENIQENIKIIHDKLSLSILEKKDKLNEASPYMPNGFSEKIMNTSKNIAELTKDIKYLSEKEQYINSEITDCMLFSKSLQFRIKSLNESKNTFVVLGEMSFNYCPSCFSTISENENATTCKCSLCKSDLPKYSLEEKYTETLTELKYQQRQNQKTITSLNSNLLDTKEVLIIKQNELRNLEFILRDYSTSTNEREIIIEEYSKKLSLIEKNLEDAISSQETFLKIDNIIQEKKLEETELIKLEKEIELKEENSKERRFSVLNSISKYSKRLLELDIGSEESFKHATSLSDEINFSKDEWSLGGRVAFSDSSNVVKKSSLQIAMLKHAIKDPQCRLPNFMILDFECGDLNAPRSHRLQQNLLNTFTNDTNFQVIITSSKVCKELNNNTYGIGKYYDTNDYIFK